MLRSYFVTRDAADREETYGGLRTPTGELLDARMDLFEQTACSVFERFYADAAAPPDDIVHVSCSGYVSPSPVQMFLSGRGWLQTGVTHSYHMGCYGAFPAIRTALGLVGSSYSSLPRPKKRVDLVHTEFLSLHFDLLGETPDSFVTSTLFADGFIKYSAYPQAEFSGSGKPGLKILAIEERILPNSLPEMTLRPGPLQFDMSLSKRVPLLIRDSIEGFVVSLCAQAGLDFEREKSKIVFAIHPGGPAILNQIRNRLGVDESQVAMSRQVLFEHGNMASATAPHIWQRITESESIPAGAKILSMAVRPGLDSYRSPFRKSLGAMTTQESSPTQRFSVPAGFYWAVRGVHAGAPLFVGLGNLESRILGRRLARARVDRPVYICGLPRAGTTITLQMLSEHPDVTTHKYADFLMPYTPYAWNWIFPKVPVDAMRKPVPRIHRDRIQVTRDSAEMGEEILWERFFPFIHDETKLSLLDANTSNPAFERFYREHILKLLLSRRRPRYVSKAIMCVIRMQYLRKMFPAARFLLYVRNPVDHVASLLKQDRIWDELDRDDPRQIEIIEMTGHHEFGQRQVMANVGHPEVLAEIRRLRDDGRIARARALYWAYVYDFVLGQIDSDPGLAAAVCVVRYEDLCGNSGKTIDRIVAHMGLAPEPFAPVRAAYMAKLSLPDYYRPSFNDGELADIVEVTGPVATRFGYDVSAIANANRQPEGVSGTSP